MKKEAIEKVLTSVPVRTHLDSLERDKVRELLAHDGFKYLLGMMLGESQAFLVMLQNNQLGENAIAGAQRLGVLQGKSMGVDILRNNLIDILAVPDEKDSNQ